MQKIELTPEQVMAAACAGLAAAYRYGAPEEPLTAAYAGLAVMLGFDGNGHHCDHAGLVEALERSGVGPQEPVVNLATEQSN